MDPILFPDRPTPTAPKDTATFDMFGDKAARILLDVPPLCRPVQCTACDKKVYWVSNRTTGARMPIDCTAPGAVAPSGGDSGRGVLHLDDCPQSREYRRRHAAADDE